MQISLTITDTSDVLQQMILKEIASAVEDAISKSIPSIKQRVGELIKYLVSNTPEYDDILNGKLGQELGLKDPGSALNQIVETLANGVTVDFPGLAIRNGSISGSVTIGMVKEKFAELTSLSSARYFSGTHEIPWLEWLLFKGDSIIIMDYGVEYKYSSKSRSQNAVMIKNGVGWRVPPHHSGTEDNNFITRAFEDDPNTEKMLGQIVEEEITSRLI